MSDRTCAIPECVEPLKTRGFCRTHYQRWVRHGEGMDPVTQPENVARAETAITTINSRKTHCIYGHPFAGANLMHSRNGDRPARQCRTCHNRRAREYQERRRARLSA